MIQDLTEAKEKEHYLWKCGRVGVALELMNKETRHNVLIFPLIFRVLCYGK